MQKILLLVFLITCTCCTSYSQIFKWRIEKYIHANYNGSKPVKPSIIDTNINAICVMDMQKQTFSIYKGDHNSIYDCYSYEMVKGNSSRNNEYIINAIDPIGNRCKIKIQIGDNIKDYTGVATIIYPNEADLYFMNIIRLDE